MRRRRAWRIQLSSSLAERDVEVSHDGLTVVFARQNRGGGSPIMMATRLNGGIPGMTTGFAGLLDGAGEATGTIATPFPALAGVTLYAGYFTIEGSAPFNIKTISNARAIELQP